MTPSWSRLLRRRLLWALLLASGGSPASSRRSRPTAVPGSAGLVAREDFPYEFWRASDRPHARGPAPILPPEATEYGYFYGRGRDEAQDDPETWQMLPIQIPDDLVGDLDLRTRGTSTEVPAYPTSPTPQYGRHPGGTEQPHLFRPERLYESPENDSRRETQVPVAWRRNHEGGSSLMDQGAFPQPESAGFPHGLGQTERPDLFSSWTQSLREQLEPFIDSTRLPRLPTLPKFPRLPSIGSLPKLPVWPLNILHNTPKPPAERETVSNLTNQVEHVVHKFYPIFGNAYPTDQSNEKRMKNRRSGYIYPLNHNSDLSPHAPNYDHSPPTHHQPERGQHPHQGKNTRDNIGYGYNHGINHEDTSFDHFPPSPNSKPALKHLKRPYGGQPQPPRNSQDSQHRRQDIQEHAANEQQFSHVGDQHRFVEGQYHLTRNQHDQLRDRGRPENGESHHVSNQQPNADQRWPSESSHSQAHNMNAPFRNTNHPSDQRINPSRNPYRNRPDEPQHPDPSRIHRRGPYHSYGSRPHYQPHQAHDYHHASSPGGWTDQLAPPALYFDFYSDDGIVERLASLDPLSSSLVIPGGLVAVALALAVYYFTYVWYPTPVVTAKVVQHLSDSAPDDLLTTDQQKAIHEVYEVFRALETEYTHDPAMWSPSCKGRLVCQVHQELPGLWSVTHTYGAFVRSSLAPGPEGFSLYLKAAQQGASGSNCGSLYPDCSMAPIPVRSTLQKLLGIPQGDSPEVVYT